MRARHVLVLSTATVIGLTVMHVMLVIQQPTDPKVTVAFMIAGRTDVERLVVDFDVIRKSPSSVTVPPVANGEGPHRARNNTDVDFPHDILSVSPSEVFYFWCGSNRIFEFRHYLSVRSAFLHLNPYRVRLLYENEPIAQDRAYNTWLTELRQDYAFFSTEKLPKKWCENKRRSVDGFLSKHGGIYVNEDVILAGPLDQRFYISDSVAFVERDSNERLIQIDRHRNSSVLNEITGPIVLSAIGQMDRINGTVRVGDLHNDDCHFETKIVDVLIAGDHSLIPRSSPARGKDKAMLFKVMMKMFPEHIWEMDNEAGRLLRTVAYGKPDITRPVPDFSRLAPNIAHVVWSNGDPMSFEFYLCVLSLLDVAKFDKVFIHGDGPPTGMYWDLISNHSRLHLVYRKLIDGNHERIYGNEVKVRAHVVDVLRVDILYRYGGLYVDTDAIFFRPLTRELRAYDAVVSPDISRGHRDFPNSYQNGIMLGKPGAKFWRLHIESMRKYYDDDWLWNCCFGMYKIKERHPETVLSEPRLNTICYHFRCYPYWEPRWLAMTGDQTAELMMTQWLNNTFAVHHCSPSLPEYASHESLLDNNGTTLYGQVALYVLRQAGKLEFFKQLNGKSSNRGALPRT